jgi:hypothetical protein
MYSIDLLRVEDKIFGLYKVRFSTVMYWYYGHPNNTKLDTHYGEVIQIYGL